MQFWWQNINHLQKVKDLVNEMDENNFQESKINTLICRPWGAFTTIEEDRFWKGKEDKNKSWSKYIFTAS